MRTAILLLSIVAIATTADATPPERSWGKADVSFDRYRADAMECSLKGGTADVRGEPETERYVRAEKVLDRDANQRTNVEVDDSLTAVAERQVLLRRMYKPTKHVDALQGKMGHWVETCLTERGYTPFTLTRAQAKALARLKPGTPERRQYLYALARDPAVLKSQGS